MFYCYDCVYEFEKPVVSTEQRSGEPSFDIETCPNCGSDDIVDLLGSINGKEDDNE